jgi:urea transport system permease protein
MRIVNTRTIWIAAFLLLAAVCAQSARADAGATGAALCAENRSDILEALDAMAKAGAAEGAKTIEALLDRRIGKDSQGRCVMLAPQGGAAYDLGSGQVLATAPEIEPVVISNQVRSKGKKVISLLRLSSPDRQDRLAAAKELEANPSEEAQEAVDAALSKETDSEIKGLLATAQAQIDLSGQSKERKLKAIAAIKASGNTSLIPNLKKILEPAAGVQADTDIRKAAEDAISSLERKTLVSRTLRDLFYGVSLGSVLLLAALGLAITFGLMGVINMAHGEMLMLGAYATYIVQECFKAYFPQAVDYYLVAAIPFAFGVSFGVGILLERGILRFLYGRPLETLLATWGISLGLIQTVRLLFGAQNVEVKNPAWLSGSIDLMEGFTLTYNRVAIIVFVIFVVLLCWAMLNKTNLGLQVRAVTQDRATAQAMGIFTWKVDMWTFALGSGVAGLGGLALTQVGNVGPELGQGYIVDSFMVVVLGGVGKLVGTVAGALGLGMINKALEPFMGAVLGKIMVLVLIILFIQKRPQGLFAFKGRSAE